MSSRKIVFGLVMALAVMTLIEPAFASSGGGGGLPWEGPLQQIQQSINGPVAGAIALAAVAIGGAMLIFGGELSDFAKRMVYIVLVAGILLGASQIISLFSASGASIEATTGPDPSAILIFGRELPDLAKLMLCAVLVAGILRRAGRVVTTLRAKDVITGGQRHV
jgi:type IV secretion system protein VirB2